MNYRKLGKTGFKVSEISLGTWQVGGKWGSVFNDYNAERIINSAIDKLSLIHISEPTRPY